MKSTGKILVAMANPDDGRKLERVLQTMGFIATSKCTGHEAWELLGQYRPDLVLFEVNIGAVSGLEFARRVREDPALSKTILVLLTNKGLDLSQYKGLDIDLVLYKPLYENVLKTEINKLIARKAQASEENKKRDKKRSARAAAPSAGDAKRKRASARKPKKKPPAGPQAGKPAHLWSPPPPSTAKQSDRQPRFPNAGSLEDISIPELFADLFLSSFSGHILLRKDNAIKQVTMLDGSVVYVDSRSRDESLGQVLVREGVISDEDCLLSIANMHTYSTSQGGALVHMGALTPLQLIEALRLQTWEKAISMFSWFTGEYKQKKESIEPGRYPVGLDTPLMIRQGLRRWYQPGTLKAIFDQTKAARFKLNEKASLDARALGMSQAEHDFLSLFDGKRSVDAIMESSPLDPDLSLQTMYWLITLNILTPEKQAERRDLDKLEKAKPAADMDFDVDGLTELVSGLASQVGQFLNEVDEPEQADSLVFEPASITAGPGSPAAAQGEQPSSVEFAEDLAEVEGLASHQAEEQNEDQIADDRFVDQYQAMQIQPEFEKPEEPQAEQQQEVDLEFHTEIAKRFLSLESMTHYEALGVDPDVSQEDIENAYSSQARIYRVERLGEIATPEMIYKLEKLLERIEAAYIVVGDTKKRKIYDKKLSLAQDKKRQKKASVLLAESSFHKGVEALKEGDFQAAVSNLETALQLFPNEADYHAYLGWAVYNDLSLKKEDRVTVSKRCIAKALGLNQKSHMGYLFLGKIFKAEEKLEAAAQVFARSYRHNPKNNEAKRELALLVRDNPELQKAPAVIAELKKMTADKADFSSVKGTVKRFLAKE